MPDLVILMGLPASGKSSFCRHLWAPWEDNPDFAYISLDVSKTRKREWSAFEWALVEPSDKMTVVVDNTNLTRAGREKYIEAARQSPVPWHITGYYMESRVQDCVARNQGREGEVPNVAIYAGIKNLEMPSKEEGFDDLFFVRIGGPNEFEAEKWDDLLQWDESRLRDRIRFLTDCIDNALYEYAKTQKTHEARANWMAMELDRATRGEDWIDWLESFGENAKKAETPETVDTGEPLEPATPKPSKAHVKTAKALLPEFMRYSEASYLGDPGESPYKPFYRALSLIMAPGEREKFGLTEIPTMEEAQQILSLTHPYFQEALEHEHGTFAHLYEFIKDTWDG